MTNFPILNCCLNLYVNQNKATLFISDDRFAKLSVKYESEQKEVAARIKELETELASDKSKAVIADMFMTSVRKYTRTRKLTPRMLNELIEKIEVHQSEKIDGKTVQQLTIH